MPIASSPTTVAGRIVQIARVVKIVRNFNNLQNSIDMIWLKDSMFSDRYMDFLHLCQDHIASLGFH